MQSIRDHLIELGAKPCHEQRLLRLWSQAQPLDSPATRPEHHLPAALRQALPGVDARLDAIARVTDEQSSGDGSIRLLIQLGDGQSIETVLLPRDGLCVSSQVGCAVGCRFCMTGRSGLLRQLSSAEIVAQLALARKRRPVNKVVFMGMGEPAHNLDAVLEAIEVFGTVGAIAHKNLVFSTVGDRRAFERLPLGRVKPALALSLHACDAERRAQLLPRAPRIDPDELVRLAEHYARMTGYPVQYQWTLLQGVNDRDSDIESLVQLLAGKYAILNLIPFNAVADAGFQRPTARRADAMARELRRRGILTKLRRSAGQEIDAGCGQLRARSGRSIVIHAG